MTNFSHVLQLSVDTNIKILVDFFQEKERKLFLKNSN